MQAKGLNRGSSNLGDGRTSEKGLNHEFVPHGGHSADLACDLRCDLLDGRRRDCAFERNDSFVDRHLDAFPREQRIDADGGQNISPEFRVRAAGGSADDQLVIYFKHAAGMPGGITSRVLCYEIRSVSMELDTAGFNENLNERAVETGIQAKGVFNGTLDMRIRS